jgi:hypothetical protein
MKNLKFILVAIVAMFLSATVAVAQEKPKTLTLPSVVGSNMVLQHSTTVNIWGWAKPKATVKINPSWLNLKKPIRLRLTQRVSGFCQLRLSVQATTLTPSLSRPVRRLRS